MNEKCNRICEAKYQFIKHVLTSENRYFVFMLTEPQEGCLRPESGGFSHKCGAGIQLWVWSLVRFHNTSATMADLQTLLAASYRSSSSHLVQPF